MASLRNAFKTNKAHRERHQPEARAHLGVLEKKKDYRERAKDFNNKKAALKGLHRRVLDKNPDEFYFHMIRSRMEDGEHIDTPKEEECTPEQLKLMQTQDLKYISHKRLVESRKIDKLQSQLHLIDAEKSNNHVFFVDTKEEAKNLDVAERLQTHPSLLSRKSNRPKLEDLKKMDLSKMLTNETAENVAEERMKSYRQLEKRIAREKQLMVAQQKMELKKMLRGKSDTKPVRITPGTKSTAPIYKWKAERKR
ncbi:probable U3 small nucleolar RNA-associated protein 11 [Daphnia pulex]|uniref:probable U3 small nucleolar RNA-associated protein 11 n=1 Tax=Daphnia pulex TaxID=6669 RepID=UPI001EE0E862|nr:probable U3 small nucleolar RNA-associated protein 11 [Daphnia pulex]